MKFGVMPQRTSFLAGEREANEGQASGPADASNWWVCSPAVETTGKRNREGSGSKLEKSRRLSNAFHFCGRRPGLLPRCLCCLRKPGPLRIRVPAALLWMRVRENTGEPCNRSRSPLHHCAAHKPVNGKEAGQHAMSKDPPTFYLFSFNAKLIWEVSRVGRAAQQRRRPRLREDGTHLSGSLGVVQPALCWAIWPSLWRRFEIWGSPCRGCPVSTSQPQSHHCCGFHQTI